MIGGATVEPQARANELATLTGQLAVSELRGGDVLAGRFRIESLLGIGGFGFVYRARDLSLNIDVALKLLRPELARRPEAFERFRQELLLARQVSSPHVVRIHDIAQHEGRWFISMDFVDGESLEHRLDRLGKLPLAEAEAITRGLLEGLAAAHQRGVIHRDLKPANILLDADGRAFITDFGVARSLGATGMTQSGIVVGTPEYLSPEQARGDGVDARSDLYAVGLMLYEMLSGSLPFSGGTPAETMMQRIVRPPPSLAQVRPDLPHWLHAFCDRLLQVKAASRFASARDALHALETRRVPRAPVQWRRLSSWVLAAAALAAAGAWLWHHPFARNEAGQANVAVIPRIAWLPLQVARDDIELNEVARALDEHAQTWLRGDPAGAAVPRRRVLDALARRTPGIDEAALLRQLPDVATAAGATAVVHGRLQRDAGGFTLALDSWSSSKQPGAKGMRVHAADAAALFTAYTETMSKVLADLPMHAGSAPPLPVGALAPLGRALIALDQGKHEMAATELAAWEQSDTPANAIVESNLLRAQEAAHQDLPAQTTRDRIVAQFANASGPLARELHARALIGNDQGDTATHELAQSVHDYPNDPALTLLYADALNSGGEGAKALDVLRRHVNVDDQDAQAWFVLGRTAIQQGQADAAVSNYLVRALVLDRLGGDQAAEALTANALGVGYERLGQLDAATQQYSQAAALREKLGDNEGLAKSLRNLAIVQAVRGDGKSADQTLDRVKLLLEKSDDRASLADLYNDRGVVAEEHGAYAEALGFYRKALALRQELNLPAQVAGSLNNVGFCFYSLGDFDNALVYWQQALAQYQKVDDRNGALRIDESIGLLDIARGHFATARERLSAALQTAEDHQLPEEAAVAHTYLGQLALLEGRYSDAALAAQHAADVFARRADQRGQAEASLMQAAVALALGDGATADKALAALQPDQLSAEQRAMFLIATAQRARMTGDLEASRQKLATAAKSAGEQYSATGIRVRLESTRLALAQGDVAGAAKLLQPLRSEPGRIAELPLRLQWLELQVAVALRGGKPADAATRYREALSLLKTTGRWADANVLHRLGARALAGDSAEVQAARSAADALEAQLLAQTPAGSRESLRRAWAQRWHEEAGDDHGG